MRIPNTACNSQRIVYTVPLNVAYAAAPTAKRDTRPATPTLPTPGAVPR